MSIRTHGMVKAALVCLAAFGFFITIPQSAVAADSRPNIVFILVDDLRWDALSCAGHPVAKTPNIDRIAREGALFKNFFTTIPLCAPSRGSFLTGQYAHTHGILDNTQRNAQSHTLVTFPRLLHDGGYETAYVGKWHMGNDDTPRPGFDRWVSFKGQGVYTNPPLNIDGQAGKVEGYMTDLLNQHAADFVKKAHTKPWALYLAHKAVHGPFTPAERHKELYADATVPLTPNIPGTRENKPALAQKGAAADVPKKKAKAKAKQAQPAKQADGKATGAAHHNTMRSQLRCLAAIDDGVGDLFKALEETKQLDNTMIVFTSDNGYFWGEHGLGDKRWAYEESIRDPLLVRYPRLVRAGTTLDQFALNIDLAPTFLDLAGLTVPASVQGRSLLPLFRGQMEGWRKSFLAEYHRDGTFVAQPWQAVRTERWKYIHYKDNSAWDELYDLKSDPYELKNLISAAAAQSTLQEMKAELEKLRKETSDN